MQTQQLQGEIDRLRRENDTILQNYSNKERQWKGREKVSAR